LFIDESWYLIVTGVILKLISSIHRLKASVKLIESHSALVCFEAMIDQEVYKDYLPLRSNSIHLSADIIRESWSNVFCGRMGDDLLCCGVGIHLSIAVAVGCVVSVDTDLIVIALSVKAKPTNQCSYPVILGLKLEAMLDVTEV
jgi:hypothetical protein